VHPVVVPVALNRIIDLALIGHADSERCGSDRVLNRSFEGGRDVTVEPAMILMRLVDLAIASGILVAECQAQTTVPHVVAPDALSPLCAGMTDVRHLPLRAEPRIDCVGELIHELLTLQACVDL